MADMKEFDGNHSKRLDSPTTSSQTHDENEEKNAAATGRPSSDVLVNEQGQEGDSQDESEYLPPWKMALVTFALCLAIFCMALVSNRTLSRIDEKGLMACRTTRLWRLQYQELRNSSNL